MDCFYRIGNYYHMIDVFSLNGEGYSTFQRSFSDCLLWMNFDQGVGYSIIERQNLNVSSAVMNSTT